MYTRLAHRAYDVPFAALLLVGEALLTTAIVTKVAYTEIDWTAYMQEVTAYQNGERDYVAIRGDTGPLVYPAGFLYLYGWLKSFSTLGDNGGATRSDELGLGGSTSVEAIRRIQWVFVTLYLFNSMIVLALYQKVLGRIRQASSSQIDPILVWTWRILMGITCLSRRVHSIFVLRLFNDAPAMTLLHTSMLLFTEDYWGLGCVAFSLAVSIKMNILLFAPGLLLLLLQKNQCIAGTIKHLSICASIQLLLGWPFLSTHPISYLRKAFELDRVFFFKWTVNWKFLPEYVFVSKPWALLLLAGHLGTLKILASRWRKASVRQRGTAAGWMSFTNKNRGKIRLSAEYIVYTMFATNYIGIAFARTLHYQFYCWYFYSLPILHGLSWISTSRNAPASASRILLNLLLSVTAIVGAEFAFNVFPATAQSSIILQISHLFLLGKIIMSDVPTMEFHDERKLK
mmetsp:Transcript_25067/g.59559  ORF Transcript_25067/g.59559 Transcript_25067/m.59559 type:complete len:456 (-) Transcript_25067:1299-2666(-)